MTAIVDVTSVELFVGEGSAGAGFALLSDAASFPMRNHGGLLLPALPGGIEKRGSREMNLAAIDHTHPEGRRLKATDVERLCAGRRRNTGSPLFASIPAMFRLTGTAANGMAVKTLACGLRLGAMSTKGKGRRFIAERVPGREEIDMVLNIGAMKDGAFDTRREDIRAVKVAAARIQGAGDVILETRLLTDAEKQRACRLAVEAGGFRETPPASVPAARPW